MLHGRLTEFIGAAFIQSKYTKYICSTVAFSDIVFEQNDLNTDKSIKYTVLLNTLVVTPFDPASAITTEILD